MWFKRSLLQNWKNKQKKNNTPHIFSLALLSYADNYDDFFCWDYDGEFILKPEKWKTNSKLSEWLGISRGKREKISNVFHHLDEIALLTSKASVMIDAHFRIWRETILCTNLSCSESPGGRKLVYSYSFKFGTTDGSKTSHLNCKMIQNNM